MVLLGLLVGVAGCGGDDGTGPGAVPRSAIVALPRTDSALPSPRLFSVQNNVLNTFQWRHSDPAQTLFAEFQFPSQSIVSVNGILVCNTCTVQVSVTAIPGTYGFVLGPPGVVLNISATPVVTVSYGTYGDLSIYDDSSTRYASEAEFEQALALWMPNASGNWVPGRNSVLVPPQTLRAGLDFPGPYLIAAPK